MKKDVLEIEEGLFDGNSSSEFKALIRIEDYEDDNVLISDKFLKKAEFLKELFTVDSKQPDLSFNENMSVVKKGALLGSDHVIIRGWKNVENISARQINSYDDTVVLECLIDKELGIYEEREFRISLFDGYEIKFGNLFLLRIFERQNEIRIEIHNDPELTLKDDFPKLNFVERFGNSRLLKKK
jgi:hypothetical protein